MARLARIVLPGYPHHVTQRGNRRQDVFFCDGDFQAYLDLLKQWCSRESVKIWAYCLMTNYVHLIVKPEEGSNLSRAIGDTHGGLIFGKSGAVICGEVGSPPFRWMNRGCYKRWRM